MTNLQGGKIFSVQDLLLDTAELNQQGQLLALGNLDATFTAPLLFTQQMAAGKRLSVTVNGDFDQRGKLQGDAVLLTSSGNISQKEYQSRGRNIKQRLISVWSSKRICAL